jgi:hypothetical protein
VSDNTKNTPDTDALDRLQAQLNELNAVLMGAIVTDDEPQASEGVQVIANEAERLGYRVDLERILNRMKGDQS